FYIISFFYQPLLNFSNIIFAIILLLTIFDYFFVFIFSQAPNAKRFVSNRLGNGENNEVQISIENKIKFKIKIEVIDELPEQMQTRNFSIKKTVQPQKNISLKYNLKPLQRGVFNFGDIILFLQSQLGFVLRRHVVPANEKVHVYPAFSNLSKQSIIAQATTNQQGSRRMQKLGQSMEFEQIKEYINGDDIRNINWKATARKGSLMVNNYIDEKSQQVYCIIDKGRLMKMPFNGLSLLDYAINATLALTNICLQKQDKIGLISFSNKIGSVIAADRKPIQRENIMQVLHKETTTFMESDFEMLYMQVRNKIKQRSLLILFTNFESLNGLKRQVNYLRSIAKHHLLIVVFFENTELLKLSKASANNIDEVYIKAIADKFAYEKRLVVKELQQYGILSVLSSPQNLTVNTINKYLELKSRQVL
ncbi:MAG: DUF58 domain-containing protein, partial [Ferruginibacter sp.]